MCDQLTLTEEILHMLRIDWTIHKEKASRIFQQDRRGAQRVGDMRVHMVMAVGLACSGIAVSACHCSRLYG